MIDFITYQLFFVLKTQVLNIENCTKYAIIRLSTQDNTQVSTQVDNYDIEGYMKKYIPPFTITLDGKAVTAFQRGLPKKLPSPCHRPGPGKHDPAG